MRKNFTKPLLIGTVLISVVIILGQVFRCPGGVRDIVTGAFPICIRLEYPALYTLLAPFFQFADHLSILSTRQDIAFVLYLNGGLLLFRFMGRKFRWNAKSALRELFVVILFNFIVAIVYAVVILVPRPMAKLVVNNPDYLILDFHSHSSYSWDARKSFSPLYNLRWHKRAGFDAAFITDHNVISGAEEGHKLSLEHPDYAAFGLVGEEIFIYRSHWIILGIAKQIEDGSFGSDLSGVMKFLNMIETSQSSLSIAYLGGYWSNNWDKRDDFAAWGVHGFEIANAAPNMLDFPQEHRHEIVEFCRTHNKLMVGASDNHGWGTTVYVWNVMELPGWRNLAPQLLEKHVLSALKENRFKAVRVLTRVKSETRSNPYWLAIDPVLQIWEGAKSMPVTHSVSVLFWIWLPWVWILFKRIRRNPYERTN